MDAAVTARGYGDKEVVFNLTFLRTDSARAARARGVGRPLEFGISGTKTG
jgi:hypothetical protein